MDANRKATSGPHAKSPTDMVTDTESATQNHRCECFTSKSIDCFKSKNLSLASRQRTYRLLHVKDFGSRMRRILITSIVCINVYDECLLLTRYIPLWISIRMCDSCDPRTYAEHLGQRIALASVSREPSWDYLIIIMIFILSMYSKSQS